MRNFRSESGFGLVEATVATLMTMTGVLSVAVLFMVGSRMQSAATNSSSAVGLAAAELERVRMLAPSAAERANGGLAVVAISPDGHALQAQLTGILWR
jgi:Tfp pilus assembly protein PilV